MDPILQQSPAGHLQIWDDPVHGRSYVVGADVAEGKVRDLQSFRQKIFDPSRIGERPDYSAAVVIEKETGVHVASWHGYIEPTEFATAVCALGLYYSRALIVPEINGPGIAVVENLTKMFKYPFVYRNRIYNFIDRDPIGASFGFRTTEQTRPMLISRVQEAINTGAAFTRDKRLCQELRTMVFDTTGKPRAMGRDKDDMVFAWALALQGRYELLYGSLEDRSTEDDRLPAYDRRVWQKKRERARNAHRDSGLHPGREPRVRALPRRP